MLPTSESLADRLYHLEEKAFFDRFGTPSADGLGPTPAVYEGVLGDRLAGTAWYRVQREPGAGGTVLAAARFSPATRRPSGLALSFRVRDEEHICERLRDVGFPVPAREPTFIIGGDGGSQAVAFMPGPAGLAELIYQVDPEQGFCVTLWSERPSEPRFSRLVEAHRRRFAWNGTMYFPDLWAFGARRGKPLPPGARPLRSLVA